MNCPRCKRKRATAQALNLMYDQVIDMNNPDLRVAHALKQSGLCHCLQTGSSPVDSVGVIGVSSKLPSLDFYDMNLS